ncbi:MAG: hypothetical protein JWM41_2716 [Gemmatimonadetes bacterium]|nr:hypothetical protein [Gemmatimonadota bacterium]
MKRWLVAGALIAAAAAAAAPARAQIPRFPGARPTVQPAPRDTTKDSTQVKWAPPDSVMQALMAKQGYSVTRYQGDTAFFNAQTHAIDLLAAKRRRVAVERDTQLVVSDSGIYYNEATRRVTTGGNYVLKLGNGQADIVGRKGGGRVEYNLAERSARISNARLPVNNGETWYIDVALARVDVDSANGKSATAYVRGGSMTTCDDSIPDYHFEFREAKRTGNTLVSRPAILYIKDVPVMWLPFIFSDQRPGRHSGIIPPQFGVGDIIRNSPAYHRNIEHLGYYWALNDYMNVSTWLDWRSGAGTNNGQFNDPGWLKYNADWDYKWLDRFLGGRIGTTYTAQRDGQTNTAVSWSHQQDFSHDSHINTSFNYVTSTTLQRQNTFNPYSALATISSQATYQTKLGPASFSLGATQKQYPGRTQLDRTFPTLSLTSTAISVGKWLTWTPNLSFSKSEVLGMDQPGLGAYAYKVDSITSRIDSTPTTNRNSAQSSLSFDTPLQIFGYDLKNSFRVSQQRNNFPQQFQIYDVRTGAVTDTRVFAATYYTYVDWTPDFTLPPFARNRFNLTPSVSLQNVDPGPFWVATERTNGQYVHQSKRITTGLSASPTLFGFFPGFGPFTRIRHSITPSIGYTYAPAAHLSDAYLAALGRTQNYATGLAQNAINLGLTQNFEAKVRQRTTDTSATAADRSQTVRLLSIGMSSVGYDFERAHEARSKGGHSKYAGLTSESWGYQLSSDLLPGFDFSSSYSLFQGSTLSDTAKFAPVLTNISASFSVGRDQNPLTVFARLFGKAVPEAQVAPTPDADHVRPRADDPQAAALAAQPVAGAARSGDRFILPTTQGWRASFTFSRSSPRQPTGSNVISFDPRARCQAVAGTNTFLLDACLAQQRAQPTTDTPVTSGTAGGPAYSIPATTSLNGNVNFNLTPKWTAAWQTTYDFERHEFASHIVSLQRELHDWRAIFGFTQSPNGNFAFNFTIALKAEPDLKFDYNRATARSGSGVFR